MNVSNNEKFLNKTNKFEFIYKFNLYKMNLYIKTYLI